MDKSDIKQFRNALHNGEVHFSYTKKDGSTRQARGTLSGFLIPKYEPIVAKFQVNKIEWADDALHLNPRPKKLKLSITQTLFDRLHDFSLDENDLNNKVVKEAIFQKFGARPISVEYTKDDLPCLENKHNKKQKDLICYYDLDKNNFRSFNESQLISWNN